MKIKWELYNPSDSEAKTDMGLSLHQLKRYEEAIEQFKQSIELQSESQNVRKCELKYFSIG